MRQDIYSALIEQLKADEGLRLEAYLCPAGHWTIGYGHNLEAHPDPDYPPRRGTVCTLEQAEKWLVHDVADAQLALLTRYPWTNSLPDGVFAALTNLCFNMGITTLATFVNALAAMRAHEWDAAAHHLEQSKWYTQVGKRAKRVVAQVRKGE